MSRQIILYIGRRNCISYYKLVDVIGKSRFFSESFHRSEWLTPVSINRMNGGLLDGIIILPPPLPHAIVAESAGMRLLLQIQLRFSYDVDQLRSDQRRDQTVILASCQLCPNGLERKNQSRFNCHWQVGTSPKSPEPSKKKKKNKKNIHHESQRIPNIIDMKHLLRVIKQKTNLKDGGILENGIL